MKLEYIFAAFALLGALDKVFGNRLKLGEEFERGIMSAGVLVLGMAGIIVLSPVLAKGLSFIFAPVLTALHIDLSLIGAFFPVDAGGAVMSYELSAHEGLRTYNGMIVASMFGVTMSFTIPLALKMVDVKYHEDVLLGLLCGIATIPVGCIVGGLLVGCTILEILINTLPIILLSIVICIGLVKAPVLIKKILGIVGDVLFAIIILGLGIGIFQQLTGFTLIPGTESMSVVYETVGGIMIILAGVFPLLAIISKIFNKVFSRLGGLLKIDDTSVLGFITTLANSVPMFPMTEKMNKKGRVLNIAFSVSAAFAIGDNLAFALAFDGGAAPAMVVGKIISGIAAIALACVMCKRSVADEPAAEGETAPAEQPAMAE